MRAHIQVLLETFSVERGFNINANTIDNNMEERTILARLTVHDTVQSVLHRKSIDSMDKVIEMSCLSIAYWQV